MDYKSDPLISLQPLTTAEMRTGWLILSPDKTGFLMSWGDSHLSSGVCTPASWSPYSMHQAWKPGSVTPGAEPHTSSFSQSLSVSICPMGIMAGHMR